MNDKRVLLIGFGNPGRLDDGLGAALAERISDEQLPGVTVESNYQLNVEDAAQIAEYDEVIFADASTDANPPFEFMSIEGEPGGPSFSSHSVTIPQLLGLTKALFHKEPEARVLAIRGYEFNEFGEKLSEQAAANLKQAVQFLKKHLIDLNQIH